MDVEEPSLVEDDDAAETNAGPVFDVPVEEQEPSLLDQVVDEPEPDEEGMR